MSQAITSTQSSQASNRRVYIAAFLFVVLGVFSVFAYLQQYSHGQAMEKAAADSANLAWVLEASLNTTLRRLDTDLIEMARTAEFNDLRRKTLARENINWTVYLAQFKTKFPEITDFFVFDAQGQLSSSSDPNAKPFSIADRQHFQKLRDDANAGLVLSDVVIARTDGRATAIFGRALHDANGRFLGIVSAILDFEHWQTIFSALDIGPNGLIALRRFGTHQLILRRPMQPQEYNQPIDTLLTRRISAGEKVGVARFTSPIDGIERVWSFRLLEDYPIYVSVAIGVDDALAVWRRQTMIAAMLMAVVLSGFGMLLVRLWRTELRRALSLEELAQSEEKVRELAYFDPLTNLPNRRFLLDRLALGLSQAKRYQRSLALMFLDLDHFKTINDTLGHVVGDELLKEVARRLVECIRTGDTISRQGGDEFVIVLTEISHPTDAANVADKIITALGIPYHIAGHEFKATISIGIAVCPANGIDDAPELMRKADKAMYAVKATGGNGYRFFSD